MSFLVDANACIDFLNSRSDMLKRRFLACARIDINVCSIVRGELIYGARKSRLGSSNLTKVQDFLFQFNSLPFDDAAADEYGRIRAHLAARGTPIGGNDMMIAAIAIVQDLTLVTANTREFLRVPRLRMENWES